MAEYGDTDDDERVNVTRHLYVARAQFVRAPAEFLQALR
jgi:hypothetical protein